VRSRAASFATAAPSAATPRERSALLDFAFEASPMAIALIDEQNKCRMVNPAFEAQLGPSYKFAHVAFDEATADDKGRQAIASALRRAREDGGKVRVRDVNMMTVTGVEGFPIARHFDWSLQCGSDGLCCAVGNLVTEADEKQRDKDAE
jgi:PAS domain-containing protein